MPGGRWPLEGGLGWEEGWGRGRWGVSTVALKEHIRARSFGENREGRDGLAERGGQAQTGNGKEAETRQKLRWACQM